ncbi:hypothetical protein ACFVH0_21355 [Streptomyces sp. NPDC127117]|uniref:hypothetical protein n=1 Tax=Streptomyces sp. NPDC127117 TaxID=3345368 RepID=UPI003634A284
MNWDLDAVDELDGVTVPRRRFFRVWASIAPADGLTPARTGRLARGLAVTPDEVTAAYAPAFGWVWCNFTPCPPGTWSHRRSFRRRWGHVDRTAGCW